MLTFLTLGCELVAFHGPMLAGRLGRGAEGYDRDSFVTRAVPARADGRARAARRSKRFAPGEAAGMLLGGTLTQLLASLGTPFAFAPPPGYVLFLDEVGERPYRLDRMVTQLRQTGLLARASAVVIGELPRCDEPSGDPTARAVMADLFADFPGPVADRVSVRPHRRAGDDAAVRRRLPRRRRRAAARSSSKRPRFSDARRHAFI